MSQMTSNSHKQEEKRKVLKIKDVVIAPVIILIVLGILFVAYPGTVSFTIVRVFAALWFLVWYKKIVEYYYQFFDHNNKILDLEMIGNNLSRFWRKFTRKNTDPHEIYLPNEYHRLVRKINISRYSRKYFSSWLSEENAPEELKNRILTGKREDDPVSIEEIREVFGELYQMKS